MKIIIRNLAREITQPELLALFQAHGSVQSCTIVMDEVSGGSKGFGFANMPAPHEAKAAIRALNGLELRGSRIRVKKALAAVAGVEAVVEDASASRTEPPEAEAAHQRPAAGPKIKKDGSRLGGKKTRTFRTKPKH